MNATVTTATEGLTGRPCQVGRITYRVGLRCYVALSFRYLERGAAWRLTWLGEEGKDAAQLPEGIAPSVEMLMALGEALGESVGLT
jgi:hypothetical protein